MMRKLLPILALVLIISISACAPASLPPAETNETAAPLTSPETVPPGPVDGFVPTVRFLFVSDVHIDNPSSDGYSLFSSMMKRIYEYTDTQPYTGLDALVMTGDVTCNGTAEQKELLQGLLDREVRGGTQVLMAQGNHDVAEGSSMEQAAELLGFPAQSDTVIGGIHLLGFSSPDQSGGGYEQITDELTAMLASAAEDADGKPILVYQHYPLSGSSALRSLLEKYPNVVSFTGHSHSSITQPGNFDQDIITTFDIGSLGMTEGGRAEKYAYRSSSCCLVELDADGSVLMQPYSVSERRFYTLPDGGQLYYYIEKPGDPSTYLYRDADRKAPAFSELDPQVLAVTERGVWVSFRTAAGDLPVSEYRYLVTDQTSGGVIADETIECAYTIETEPERRAVLLPSCAAGTVLKLMVIAEDARGLRSAEAVGEVTVPAPFLPARRVAQDGLFTAFETDPDFAPGGDMVYRAQFPGDYVTLGLRDHLNLRAFSNVSRIDGHGGTVLSVSAGYGAAQELHIFSTEENGLPNSFPGANYLTLWADFSEVELHTGNIGVIDANGTRYTLRVDPEVSFWFLPDGGTEWQTLSSGRSTVFGLLGGCEVKGKVGTFAFPLDAMEEKETGAAPDPEKLAGILLEWMYSMEPVTRGGTPFLLDDIALVSDYRASDDTAG